MSETAPLIDHDAPTKVSAVMIIRFMYCIISNATMMVLLRVWGIAAPGHSYLYSMSWAAGFTIFFLIALGVVWRGKLFGRERSQLDRNTRPMILQSLVASLMLAINYLGVSVSNPHVRGPTQVILAQIPTVLSVVVSGLILRRRYNWKVIGSAIVVIAGTIVAMVGAGVSSGSTSFAYALLYIFGMLPLAISPTTYEMFYKMTGLDGKKITLEWRMTVTNFMLIGWLCIFIPIYMAFNEPPKDQFTGVIGHGLSCVITGRGGLETDDCTIARPVLLATAFLIAPMQMHSQALLSREETGLQANLALSLSPFLADVVFPFLPEKFRDIPSLWNILAGGICIVGVCGFVFFENRQKSSFGDINDNIFSRFFSETVWDRNGIIVAITIPLVVISAAVVVGVTT